VRNRKRPFVEIALILLTSCQSSPPVTQKPAVSPTPSPQPILDAPEITVSEFFAMEDDIEGQKTSLMSAWRKIPGWKRYRIARSTDFRIPAWVEKEDYRQDVERAINHAHASGEMSGAQGLALIVVDKTISDAKRYSCVVFISRGKKLYDLYWIFKNEDLSHFTMGRHSGDVYLKEYRDDQTTRLCDIQYSRKQKRWACEFY